MSPKILLLSLFLINFISSIHAMHEAPKTAESKPDGKEAKAGEVKTAKPKKESREDIIKILDFHSALQSALENRDFLSVKHAFDQADKAGIDAKQFLNILIDGQHSFMQLAALNGCELDILQLLHARGEKIHSVMDAGSVLRIVLLKGVFTHANDPMHPDWYHAPYYTHEQLYCIIRWLIACDPYVPRNYDDPILRDFFVRLTKELLINRAIALDHTSHILSGIPAWFCAKNTDLVFHHFV